MDFADGFPVAVRQWHTKQSFCIRSEFRSTHAIGRMEIKHFPDKLKAFTLGFNTLERGKIRLRRKRCKESLRTFNKYSIAKFL